ncbi:MULTISPECIES: ribonuclease E/G [Hyphobacterium]|uniref:Ribonuclease E n=1 Tax=Hyphobacterium vulgare TaxID=1736751 RepID=A0ABV7A0S2_9PROT
MPKKMLIDAGHREETRVVVIEGSKVEEFDFEAAARKPIRGNIYLAKVTRVEPSLQAAFVEYGGNRHGFLAFNEIHPDYYQIPHEDRVALQKEEEEAARADDSDDDDDSDDEDSGESRRRRNVMRRYKIQEVIKRRQILLVQVAKEERGNKGAALTTYLSLAGRYCVLMPNTPRGGGISRKIANAKDRKRLKDVVSGLDLSKGMGLIIRTAGAARTKAEIRRDYDYLRRLWDNIREKTLTSVAPALIYEEGDLVKRAIRDLYDKDIETVLVQGEEAYKDAKAFIRMLMPSHASKVQAYRGDIPLFQEHRAEGQLEAIYDSQVQLKSGGYLVIHQTEALVAIDVNSGRSTRERNIEATALKTNIEAADEAARQMRLRDLAGLIVIDFIDMEESKNVRVIEKRMKDALKRDRARLQMGKISQFGLMEISRQRRRTSLLEGSTKACPTCKGAGFVRSTESAALVALRALEEEGAKDRADRVRLTVPTEVALYLLNEKRDNVLAIEARSAMRIVIGADPDMTPPECKVEMLDAKGADSPRRPEPAVVTPDPEPEDVYEDIPDDDEDEDEAEANVRDDTPVRDDADGNGNRRRRRRRRGGRAANGDRDQAPRQDAEPASDAGSDESDDEADRAADASDRSEGDDDGQPKKRRRRGRRGGRGRRRRGQGGEPQDDAQQGDAAEGDGEPAVAASGSDGSDALNVVEPTAEDLPTSDAEPRKRTRPSRRKKAETAAEAPAEAVAEELPAGEAEPASEPPAEADAKPKRSRRKPAAKTPKPAAEPPVPEAASPTPEAEAVTEAAPAEEAAKPKRTRKKAVAKAPEAAPAAGDAPAEPDAPASDTNAPEALEEADNAPKKRGWWQRGGKLFS